MVKKFLVTTSLKETWPSNNEKIIFLGEWCKLYSEKNYWENLDSEVLNYHWNNRDKYERDYQYLLNFYEKTLEIISVKLNEIHNVNYNSRYWRILIGPWLALLIQAVFDRWEMIQVAIDSEYYLKTNIVDDSDLNWTAYDYKHFQKLVMEDDGWNNFIFTRIIELHKDKIEIKRRSKNNSRPIQTKVKVNTLKRAILNFYQLIVSFLNSNSSSLIISSYLRKIDEIILSLKLFQLPLFSNIHKIRNYSPDIGQRKWVLDISKSSDFEKFILNIIPNQLPSAYLEGYKSLKEKIVNLNWLKILQPIESI